MDAAARLAEAQLRTELTARDERLRERNMPHLLSLRGEPGALLTPTGRVIAAAADGPLPQRVDVSGREILLADGRSGRLERLSEGYLLRLPTISKQPPSLSLSLLGNPIAVLGGREHPLSPRHAEILAALALRPEGLTAEGLALATHGESGTAVTVRAEMHRLRAQLGGMVLGRKPYHLVVKVEADFLRVRAAARSGNAAEAVRFIAACCWSAPKRRWCARRARSCTMVRAAALHCGQVEVLWAFAEQPHGADDVEVHERLARVMAPADPRRASVLARLRSLT